MVSMKTTCCIAFFFLFIISAANKSFSQVAPGVNDTLVTGAVVFEGDTIEAKTLAGVYIYTYSKLSAKDKWTRLRNAVYVTYPYARRAALVLNDVNKNIQGKDKAFVSNYINSR